jgi:thioredoxin-like negative regulator of GroEL
MPSDKKKSFQLRGGIKNSKGMIIIQFSLKGSPTCGVLYPALKQLQASDPGQFELHEIMAIEDGKEHPLAKEYNVYAVPTVIIWKDGVFMDEITHPFIEDVKRAVRLWGDKYDQKTSVQQKEDVESTSAEAAG